ncbi:MAG: EamA family transporter [bacterium]|nr:EamA family transporter [bacterium]
MQQYIVYAVLAGVAWGVGGYFEKSGLQSMGLPPIIGIVLRTAVALIILGAFSIPVWKSAINQLDMKALLAVIIGGGVIAGSLGMWSFYSALSVSENLGVTLAIAFACSPVAGTIIGLLKGNQYIDFKIGLGILAIIIGIILIQLSHKPIQ